MVPPLRLQLMIYWTLLMWTTQELTISADQVNIARLATISATPHNTYNKNDYKKENAVDGQIDTSDDNIDDCGCCYVSSTADDIHFTASFAGHYHVQQIVIIGRQLGVPQSQQLSDITVYLDDVSVQVDTSGTNRATVTPRSASVQTIRITLHQTTRRLLVICEIYVMASGRLCQWLSARSLLTSKWIRNSISPSYQFAGTNIAKTATLTASPFLEYGGTYYTINKAVDGKRNYEADTCDCCYSSTDLQSPYLQADFHKQIEVFRIVIKGRTDKTDADSVLTNVTVTLDGAPALPDQNRTISLLVVIPTSSVQVIRVERSALTGTWFLMICELQVFTAKCGGGFYGYECNKACPQNCAGPCDYTTGNCTVGGGCVAGFRGDYCNTSCSTGKFGPNCVSDCYCKDNAPCNATGQCANGCAAGWIGSTCSLACDDGSYGENCAHSCMCMNYTTCDKALGNCSVGCNYGWTGFNCSTNLNLLPRIMDSIHTNMSPVDQNLNLNSSLAVDGRYDLVSSTFSSCSCCSLTRKVEKSWWQLDLGRLYLIQEIYVIGRQRGDFLQQSSQLISTVSNSTNENGTLPLSSNQSLWPTVYYYSFEQPRVFQYLTVRKEALSKLAICEVILIEGVCSENPGKSFGDKCSRTCHCADGQPCDRATGKCQSPGCLPGWIGDACDEACPHGSFGDHCFEKCHCLNNASCNNVNGTCPNHLCAAGWILYNCSQVCLHGTFGRNCSTKCHCFSGEECDPFDGACPGGLCEPGWQQGSCSQGCDERMFGINCSSQCHCYNGTSCMKGNGTCLQYTDRCEAGWLSDNCSVVCSSGSFGDNCSEECHCLDEAQCDNVNGTCDNLLCADGWMLDSCSQVCLHGTFGRNCSADCHCQSGAECDHVDGKCHDGLCEPGWQQDNCSQVCPHGYFGERCSKQCHCLEDDHCDNVDGICHNHKCASGWRHGNCSQECGHGTFGDRCLKRCNCLNNERCENVNGICQNHRCAAGWRLNSCSQECGHRSFGLDCNATCNCHNGTDCEKANGTCPLGGKCDDGWHGLACSIAVAQVGGPGGGGSGGSGAAIGGAVAAVVVAIAAVVGFLVWKRRGKRSADKRPQRMLQDDSRSFDAVAESEFNGNKRPAQEQTVEVNKAYEGESSDYYSFTPLTIAEKSITLPKLWHYIRKHQQDSNTLLYEEFATLPYGLHHPVSESQKPANKKKNRYKDMYAYDHSRVVLEVTGPGETDYVNACHVHGHSEPKKFIASQGPMDAMVNDFWRMVWQQNVTRIVMLTNPKEAGAVKCIEYWPETEDIVYGGVRVTYVGSDNFTDYIRRDFTITVGGEERAVSQFHFKSWPDKDVPDNTWCLVGFWRAVNDVSRGQDREAPVLVHCSAGVGRTGTYIALDNLYTQMKAEGVIRPLQTVHSLRQQRVNMVQTKEQYAFLHEAVADALGVATHYVFTSQFPEIYRYLTEADPQSGRTRLEDQFDIVRDIVKECEDPAPVPDIDEVEYANTSHTPEIDAYRPKTRKRSSKHIQEMGAMYLPCFSGANTFLVGKSPSENSLVEFWSLVQEENIKTVISLCEPSAHNYETVCTLGTDSSILNGSFVVDMTTECKQKAFTDTTFVYNEEGKDDEDERRTVKVFAYTAWKSGYETPGDALSLLEFVEAVHAWQPHISESQPILIHCGSGTRRSGIICLVMSELARVKREDGQLNILDSLIRLKQRNNGVIHSVEQYRFCHDVILNSLQQQQQQLDSQNIYANV